MSFGQQSGPPASAKQVSYLLALVQKAGHAGFRDARGPLGLTQRQAAGKFTGREASALIDRLLTEEEGGAQDGSMDGLGLAAVDGRSASAAERLDAERDVVVRGLPAGVLAGELERRGWTVTPP